VLGSQRIVFRQGRAIESGGWSYNRSVATAAEGSIADLELLGLDHQKTAGGKVSMGVDRRYAAMPIV
jgi:hypothetical protein